MAGNKSKSLSEKSPDARLASPRKRSLLDVNEHSEDEYNDADGTLQAGSKIIITGAAGTGKTSLIDSLFDNPQISSQYSKIEETVRVLCAERGYSSPYEIKDDVHKFREDLLARQIQIENSCENFISDRSAIDAWSYFMRWSWNYVEVERAETYYQQAFAQAQKYDLIIYVPIMFETVYDDGFRWDNKIYQAQMDRLIRSVICDWGLESRVYEIKSINKAERVEEILSCFEL